MLDLRLAVTDDVVADYHVKITCRPEIHKNRTGGKLDKEQSLAVYPEHLHCYGCGFHMDDPFEALGHLLKVLPSEARELAAKYDTDSLDAYRERAAQEARRDPLPSSLASLYHDVLRTRRKDRLNWLYARGLDDGTIFDFKLGHDGRRFVIPVLDRDDHLVTLRYRRDDAFEETGPKYSGMKGRNGLYTYPDWVLTRPENRDFTHLVLVEGELDAARLWQEGIPALSATNGAGQTHKLPKIIREQFPWIEALIIATDQDEPGQAASKQTREAAEALGFRTYRLEWKEGKDVTEALQLGSIVARDFGLYVA